MELGNLILMSPSLTPSFEICIDLISGVQAGVIEALVGLYMCIPSNDMGLYIISSAYSGTFSFDPARKLHRPLIVIVISCSCLDSYEYKSIGLSELLNRTSVLNLNWKFESKQLFTKCPIVYLSVSFIFKRSYLDVTFLYVSLSVLSMNSVDPIGYPRI